MSVEMKHAVRPEHGILSLNTRNQTLSAARMFTIEPNQDAS